MAKKTTNGTNGTNGRSDNVTLGRDEYAAFMAREESYALLINDHARLRNNSHDQGELLSSQSVRMAGQEQKVMHLERVIALQRVLIDQLRDGTKTAAMDDLSEFWHQWVICTENIVAKQPNMRGEVEKAEPHLFNTWRLWQRDAGKVNRTFSMAGSRIDIEMRQPQTSREMQEHIIRRLREENAQLAARVATVEAEVKAEQDKKPQQQEKKP